MILVDTTLPDQLQDEVARQAGPRLARLLEIEQQHYAEAELEYTLPCWFLGRESISANKALRDSATPSHLWHHQVLLDGKPSARVRSVWDEHGQEGVNVVEVGYSGSAVDLGQALTWLANQQEREMRLRLLLAPSLYMTCLWLMSEEEDYVVVAHAPAGYTHLEKQRMYLASEFLHTLVAYPPL